MNACQIGNPVEDDSTYQSQAIPRSDGNTNRRSTLGAVLSVILVYQVNCLEEEASRERDVAGCVGSFGSLSDVEGVLRHEEYNMC
jgi:hypothetical protein